MVVMDWTAMESTGELRSRLKVTRRRYTDLVLLNNVSVDEKRG